jgi:U3 small nucleolar RNA-associated protein 18
LQQLSFSIDRGAGPVAPASAWEDTDDANIAVDVSQTDRLKKLKYSKSRGAKANTSEEDIDNGIDTADNGGDIMSGGELNNALRERYQTREVQWASAPAQGEGGEEGEGEGADGVQDPLSMTGSMAAGGAAKGAALPKGRVQLQRIMDANAAEASSEGITACQFSASGDLIVVGGTDKWLRVFKIDDEEKSEKILGTRFNEMPILGAQLLGEDSAELIVIGRKPYFYSYDLETGIVTKIRSLVGSGKGLNSHETMAIAPDGAKIAFAGAGGYVHILSGQQKTWMMDLKMNTAVRAVCFASDTTVLTAGLDADVYTWDIRHTARCVSRVRNEDGTCVSFLQSSARRGGAAGDFLTAVGSESGVVSLYNSHCQYKDVSGSSGGSAFGSSAFGGEQRSSYLESVLHKPLRSVMNLSTKISCMAAHPSGQMLAVASDQKRDQLRLIHTATGTVFENWPTENTPLRLVFILYTWAFRHFLSDLLFDVRHLYSLVNMLLY